LGEVSGSIENGEVAAGLEIFSNLFSGFPENLVRHWVLYCTNGILLWNEVANQTNSGGDVESWMDLRHTVHREWRLVLSIGVIGSFPVLFHFLHALEGSYISKERG